MMVRVSPYGPHYDHRTPLAGYLGNGDGLGEDEGLVPTDAPQQSLFPSPGAVFGTVAGVSLAVPLVVILGHRMFVRGSNWSKAAQAGLMAAGVLYVLGALGTAGVAAGVTSAVNTISET